MYSRGVTPSHSGSGNKARFDAFFGYVYNSKGGGSTSTQRLRVLRARAAARGPRSGATGCAWTLGIRPVFRKRCRPHGILSHRLGIKAGRYMTASSCRCQHAASAFFLPAMTNGGSGLYRGAERCLQYPGVTASAGLQPLLLSHQSPTEPNHSEQRRF